MAMKEFADGLISSTQKKKQSGISDRLLDAGAQEKGAYKKVPKINMGGKGEGGSRQRNKSALAYNANVDKTYNDAMTRAKTIVSNIDIQDENANRDANLSTSEPTQPTPPGMSVGDETFMQRKRKQGASVAGSLGIA